MNNNKIRLISILPFLITVFLHGCGTLPTLPGPTTIYNNEGERIKNPPKSAMDKFEKTLTYEFTYEDVFDATKTALFREGFEVRSDISKGIVMGSGRYYLRGEVLAVPFTMVAVIKVVDNKPTTQMTLKVDAFWDKFYAGAIRIGSTHANDLGAILVRDIQTILSSY